MLTVLVILTLLVILAVAFIQVVRTEIRSTENFKNALIVQDVAKTGIASLRQEFTSLAYGKDGVPFTGDEVRPYVSLLDSWAIGKADYVDPFDAFGPRTVYDLRPWLFNQVSLNDLRINGRSPVLIHNGSVWEAWTDLGGRRLTDTERRSLFARRGVDEDPPGDFNMDDAPGLFKVDDDFDGIVDDDPSLPFSQQRSVDDDDEDGLVDEDGIDLRRLVLGEVLGDPRVDNINLALDEDGDFAGPDPNAGRINVAIAGNRNGVPAGQPYPAPSGFPLHRSHQGRHPSELDLEAFCSLMLGIDPGVTIAQRLIEFREGLDRGPGVARQDEKVLRTLDSEFVGNDDILILNAGDPLATLNDVRGDGVDNDRDGLTDEEDEIYAGPTLFPEGPGFEQGYPGDLLDNRGGNASLLTNGVDDGGLGNVIDDIFEIDTEGAGIDDLAETRPRNPYGDDSPPLTRLSVGEIEGMNQTLPGSSFTPFRLLDRYITVESTSTRFRQDTPQDTTQNRHSLNPNLILSQTPLRSRKPLSYLYPLIGLDNDGDWGTDLRDPIVFDIDRAPVLRDDLNGNQIPDGDWDTDAEITSGPLFADNIDDDLDTVVDDSGDANRDGVVSYDPEGHVDEDPVSFNKIKDSDRTAMIEDINGSNTFHTIPVPPLYTEDGRPGDRVDNNSNRTIWMSDGIDNDGDGLTDESFLDEINNKPGITHAEALDEGVDEPGEFYILSWDREAIDGVDNNANSSDFEDLNGDGRPTVGEPGVNKYGQVYADGIDNNGDGEIDEFIDDLVDDQEEVTRTVERYGIRDNFPGRFLFKHDEDPMDIQFVANLADSLDYTISPQFNDGASKVQIRSASDGLISEAWGNEAIRITEVMARPFIRLQPESLGDESPAAGWALINEASEDSSQFHFVGNLGFDTDATGNVATWEFPNIPPGNYHVILHSFFRRSLVGRQFNLGTNTSVEVEGNQLLPNPGIPSASDVFFPSVNFRTAFLGSVPTKAVISDGAIPVDDTLNISIRIGDDSDTNISFDYIELYAPEAQYLELCNFGERPINLAGWEIRSGTNRITRLKPEEDKILLPGQFAVIYSVDEADDLDPGPAGLDALEARQYPGWEGSADPLVLTQEDRVDSATGSDKFELVSSLEEIVFGSDEASLVQLWAPYDILLMDADPENDSATRVLVDSFYYNASSDFCSPAESFKRQETFGFAPQHRGDPTRSLLLEEAGVVIADETYTVQRYVHGPMRYLAEDAVVTVARPGEEETGADSELEPTEIFESSLYKPLAIVGRATVASSTLASERTEYGEILFELSERVRDEFDTIAFDDEDFPQVTFHWRGILNHFRDITLDPGTEASGNPEESLPVLFVRAGGVSSRPIGMVDFNPRADGEDVRLAFHGDLLYVIDPTGKSRSDFEEDYADILDLLHDSIRITIRMRDSETDLPADTDFEDSVFAYLEISPGLSDGDGLIAGDPGREHFYYPDLPRSDEITQADGRFLYMERRRCPLEAECDPGGADLRRHHRSLRFREGRMGNFSPYLAGANGRNIEKYSMGRGVFAGPTARELAQIATRMEFLSDPVVDGLLNVNVADQKVLFALPFFPPESAQFIDLRSRLILHALLSQVVVMGRSQRGFDGEVGNIGVDDDRDGATDLFDLGYVEAGGAPLTDRFTPSWDANPGTPIRDESFDTGFGEFGVDDNGDGFADDPFEYTSPGSDDGPYTAVGDMVVPFLHPLVIEALQILQDPGQPQPLDLKPARQRLLIEDPNLFPAIDETDVAIMLGRIMNLITIQANEFTVTSRARVIDPEVKEILAEQKLEETFGR